MLAWNFILNVGLKLDKTTLDMLGKAKSVKITKDSTTFVEGAGDPGSFLLL